MQSGECEAVRQRGLSLHNECHGAEILQSGQELGTQAGGYTHTHKNIQGNNRGSQSRKDTDNIAKLLQEQSRRGWDQGPERLLLTLTRPDSTQAWGFSCHGGEDLEHWGGLLSGEGEHQSFKTA